MYEEVENNLTKDERISVERLRVEHRVQNGGSWSEHQPDYIVRYQDYYGEVRLFCQECGGFLQNFAFGGGRSEVTPRCRANMHGRTCNTITRFVFISGGPAR